MPAPTDPPRATSTRRSRAQAASSAAGAAAGSSGEALPLARRALYQDVADRLRQMIYDRRLPPGSWIDELSLCEDLGISRTPLREALKVLAVEGLVTMQVRRGAFVAEVSHEDVRQVYQLLALLESDAAAAVARQATDAEMAELRALHDRLERQVRQREAFFATNEVFHLRLLQLGRNRWREQLVRDLRKVMKLNRHHSLLKRGRLTESLAEHRALMSALEARDAPGAAALMRTHFDNGLEAATAGSPELG
jgi:DNA-binding GntR family transcriptional regulator